MTSALIVEEAARRFWEAAGGRPAGDRPVDIATAVARALPAGVIAVEGLTTGHVSAMLDRIDASPWRDASPRALRGCVVAQAGMAVILVRAEDPEEERRFSVAHEAAHLELHYLGPRRRALDALGPRVQAVLDGTRPPTRAEAFSAALRDIDVTPFQHAMDRTGHGLRGAIAALEGEADDLAVELLAPRRALDAMADVSPGAIRARFGLPARLATTLAAELTRKVPTAGVVGIFARR